MSPRRRCPRTCRTGYCISRTAPGRDWGAALVSGLQAVIANPLIIALIVLAVVVLLYWLVGTEIVKMP